MTKNKPENFNKSGEMVEALLFLPENENRRDEGGLRKNGLFKKSSEGKPLISIITVVFNDEQKLEKTIQSVLKQLYDYVEYIIIDAGSMDGTLDIIKKYNNQIDYWVSEPDKGLYDAMNKGISLSSGYILMLNSGDILSSNHTLKNIAEKLVRDDVIYYGSVWNYNDYVSYEVPPRNGIKSLEWIKSNIPPHQGSFIHANIHRKCLYPIEYKIGADAYLLNQLKKSYEMIYLNERITHLILGGKSNAMTSFKDVYTSFIDDRKIYKDYYSRLSKPRSFYLGFVHFLKYIFRIFFPDKYYYKIFFAKYYGKKS